ncbi:MAG: hypothetical protein Q8941_24730 [Bacteroidota bacterium]|nr:hypothetical protein [Bacteroidota bacterium]
MYRSILKTSITFLAAFAFLSFTKVADKANFSGSWSLNEGKSELGDFARFATRKIKVEQKDDAITISKTGPSFNGDDITNTETITFDGKTSESTVFGNAKKKSTAKWTDDGKTLSISYSIAFERNGQTFDITGTETWMLTNDGKSLSLQNVSSSPQGERTTKAQYDKD